MQIHRKNPFYENASDLILIFTRFKNFFLRIYFLKDLRTLLAASILFKEKKSEESKARDFICSDILSWDFFLTSFLFQFFLRKLFYKTFYHFQNYFPFHAKYKRFAFRPPWTTAYRSSMITETKICSKKNLFGFYWLINGKQDIYYLLSIKTKIGREIKILIINHKCWRYRDIGSKDK